MATTDLNLRLNITADNKASWPIDQVTKSTENLQKQTFQWSKSTEATLKKVWATATIVAWSMIALWKSFVDSAIETEPLRNSFERLSESAQISADAMLKAMRDASRWTVADTKLMESANKAYSLWIVSNIEDMTTMMEIARVKGQAMWRSMEEALDDIVTWLWRWSVQILDNLWIVIKQTEAQELYAKSLWKTVSELTEAEKKQALVNAVVMQGKKELEDAWEVQETMQEKLARVNAQRENLKVTLWEALLPVVDRLLKLITPVVEKVVNWIEENPKLTATIFSIITAVAWLTAVVSWLALALPTIWTAITVLSWPIWWIIGAITLVATARANNWWWIQEKTKVAVERIEKIIWPRLEKLQARWQEHWDTVMEYVEKIVWFIADLIWTSLWLIATTIAWTFTTIESWFKLFQAIWDGDWEWVCNVATERATNMDNLLTESFWDTWQSIKDWVQGVYDWIVEKLTAVVSTVKNIVGQIKDAWNSTKDAVSNFTSSAVDRVTSFFGWWKATWWPVYWWTPYLVGERWPELFVPATSWTIVPNNEIVNNNWITVNVSWVSVRNDNDIQTITDEIIRKIKLEKTFWIA